MKELSVEEKAKAYDDALSRVKSLISDAAIRHLRSIPLNEITDRFPELKESEDERMREMAIKAVYSPQAQSCIESWGVNPDDVIAWLERQGEQKSNLPIDDVWVLDYDELIKLPKEEFEKQGEQKTANKVEPKFHEGEWITDGNITIKIEAIKNDCYLCGDCTLYSTKTADKVYHLWTIQDAKDGDVLSYRDGQWIFVYKEKIDNDSFSYHALYSTIQQDLTINDSGFTLLSDAITPATKEQRDLLFQKMIEAGYEWDVEKKELKKIEQKPAEWSEEDEQMCQNILECLRHGWRKLPADILKYESWLKSLRHQNQWKPTEEQMKQLFDLVCESRPQDHQLLQDIYFGLKDSGK